MAAPTGGIHDTFGKYRGMMSLQLPLLALLSILLMLLPSLSLIEGRVTNSDANSEIYLNSMDTRNGHPRQTNQRLPAPTDRTSAGTKIGITQKMRVSMRYNGATPAASTITVDRQHIDHWQRKMTSTMTKPATRKLMSHSDNNRSKVDYDIWSSGTNSKNRSIRFGWTLRDQNKYRDHRDDNRGNSEKVHPTNDNIVHEQELAKFTSWHSLIFDRRLQKHLVHRELKHSKKKSSDQKQQNNTSFRSLQTMQAQNKLNNNDPSTPIVSAKDNNGGGPRNLKVVLSLRDLRGAPSEFRRHEVEMILNEKKKLQKYINNARQEPEIIGSIRRPSLDDLQNPQNRSNRRMQQGNVQQVGNLTAPETQGENTCQSLKSKTESSENEVCDCERSDISDLTVLKCDSNCGVYCNKAGTVCGKKSTKTDFSVSTGTVVGTTEIFQYKSSPDGMRTETLELGITADNEYCSFSINSLFCDCFMKPCGAGGDGSMMNGTAPLVDCRLLLNSQDDIYDFCDKNLTIEETETGGSSPFQYFAAGQFEECTDNSPPNDVCNDTDNPVIVISESSGGNTNGTKIIASLTNALQYPGVESCASGNSENTGLWYNVLGNGSGVRVSTCAEETTFDTQISIYTGSCTSGPNQLQCVAGNDDSVEDGVCSVISFFAEQDFLYHIRIHGFEGSTGTAGILFEEANLAIPFCESYKFNLEFDDPITETTCECSSQPNNQDAFLMCKDQCSYCRSDVCADKFVTYSIGTGSTINIDNIQTDMVYTRGVVGSVILETSGCSNNGEDCSSCRVNVDGVDCNSCSTATCLGTDEVGYVVNCTNVDTAATFSTCDDASSVTQSSLFQALFSTSCVRDPTQACNTLSAFFNGDDSVNCNCATNDGSNTTSNATLLTCSEPNCIFCDQEYNHCAISEFGASIDDLGQIMFSSESYQFTEGRTELITLLHDAEDDTCEVKINDEKCSSCSRVTCAENNAVEYEAYQVDCSNIESGATLNECDALVPEVGLLAVFVEGEYENCLDANADVSGICIDEASFQQQFAPGTSICDCESDGSTNGYIMTCMDPTCLLCNREATSCAFKGEGTTYNRFGILESFFEKFDYEVGRNETVVVSSVGTECAVRIDDTQCNGCDDIVCTDGFGEEFFGTGVNCENVEGAGSYDDCGEIIIDDGVLEVASDYEFDVCVDQSATAESACREEKSVYDAFSGFICNCTGPGEILGEFVLSCKDTSCLYCNDAMNACGHELFSISYNRFGDPFYRQDGFLYVSGINDEIFVGSTDGISKNRVVTVNGETCAGHEFVTCQDDLGFIYEDANIKCDNVPNGQNFEGCSTSNENFKGLFAFLSPFEFKECFESEDPALTCNETASFFSFNPDIRCECDNHDMRSTILCDFPECKYCNEARTVCQTDSFAETYGEFGVVSVLETYQYIEGRGETLTVETFYPELDCSFAIDGTTCMSCAEVQCPNGPFGPYTDLNVDCSNLSSDGEMITYSCGEGHPIFQVFFDQSFVTCRAEGETNTPETKNTLDPTRAPAQDIGLPTPAPQPETSPPSSGSGYFSLITCFSSSLPAEHFVWIKCAPKEEECGYLSFITLSRGCHNLVAVQAAH